jgi:hypothetical protein
MTPHTSGTSLSAQARDAAGTREILECWFDDRRIPDEYLIVQAGALAGAHAYSQGPLSRRTRRVPSTLTCVHVLDARADCLGGLDDITTITRLSPASFAARSASRRA